MTQKDYPFAVDLANTMNWNMAIEDFEFMATLEPKGCFLLVDQSRRVGIATCIRYKKMGWLGNLIVQKAYRHQGAGSLLAQHAITYLQTQGAESVGLYCEPPLTKFYSRLGFKPDIAFTYLHGTNPPTPNPPKLPKIKPDQLTQITNFDHQHIGENRKKLLQTIIPDPNNLCYYIPEKDKIVGYVAASVCNNAAWVGPLICAPTRYDVASSLIKTVLAQTSNKTIYAAFPKNEPPIRNLFLDLQNTDGFELIRMFFGPSRAKNCIYMAESLERG